MNIFLNMINVLNPDFSSFTNYFDSIAIIISNFEGTNTKILDFNKGAEKLLGYTKDEVIGKKISILHRQKDVARFNSIQKRVSETGESISEETKMVRKNGDIFPVFINVTPYKNEKGNFAGFIGTAIDLSKQKHAETMYTELFNNMLNGVAIYKMVDNGKDFEFIDLNKFGQKFASLKIDEIRGKKITEVLPSVKKFGLLDVFKRVWESGIPETYPLLIHKDKRINIWIDNFVYKLPTGELVNIYEDISERVKAIEALKFSEKEKTAILNGISSSIAYINTNLDILWANEKFHKKYKLKDNVIGKKCHKICNNNHTTCNQCLIPSTIKTKKSKTAEIKRTDGTIWETKTEPVLNDNNEIIGILTISSDITQKKKTQQLIEESQYRLNLALESNKIGIWDYEVNTEEVWIDKNYSRIIGYTLSDLGKKHNYSIYHPEDLEAVKQKLSNYVKGKTKNYKNEFRIIKKNKDIIWILSQGKATEFNKWGKPTRIIGTAQDITDAKLVEQELQEYREQLEDKVKSRTKELELKTKSIEESRKALTFLLEDVNEAREELKQVNAQLENVNKELESFAYSISHDLRAPLRHIDGFINLLNKAENQNNPEKVKKYSKIISEAATKMGQLIDDLLTFSRIGRNEVRKFELNINELINEIIKEYEAQIANRKIQFKIDKIPTIYADKMLMKVVFYNLIDNAIKFTRNKKEAKIHIGASEDKKNKKMIIFIEDNGAGFNIKYVHKLFGVFQRLHSDTEFEGTGIGLASVQRIINKHGGKIWAEGEIGKGATFYIEL